MRAGRYTTGELGNSDSLQQLVNGQKPEHGSCLLSDYFASHSCQGVAAVRDTYTRRRAAHCLRATASVFVFLSN